MDRYCTDFDDVTGSHFLLTVYSSSKEALLSNYDKNKYGVSVFIKVLFFQREIKRNY